LEEDVEIIKKEAFKDHQKRAIGHKPGERYRPSWKLART